MKEYIIYYINGDQEIVDRETMLNAIRNNRELGIDIIRERETKNPVFFRMF